MINNIFMIIGPSGSGKDTIYNRLLKDLPELKPVRGYTTRGKRGSEIDGVHYFFVSEEEFNSYDDIIDRRSYEMYTNDISNKLHKVYYGNRYSFFNNTDKPSDYVCISTLEGLEQFLLYDKIDNSKIHAFFLDVPEDVRRERMVDRDLNKDNNLNLNEINRRIEADKNDFSDAIIGYISDKYNINIYIINGDKPTPQVVTDIKKVIFNLLDRESTVRHIVSLLENNISIIDAREMGVDGIEGNDQINY